MLEIPHGLSTHSCCLPSVSALIGFSALSSIVLVPNSVKFMNSFHSLRFNPFITHKIYVLFCCSGHSYFHLFAASCLQELVCCLYIFISSSTLEYCLPLIRRLFSFSVGSLQSLFMAQSLDKQQYLTTVTVKYACSWYIYFSFFFLFKSDPVMC